MHRYAEAEKWTREDTEFFFQALRQFGGAVHKLKIQLTHSLKGAWFQPLNQKCDYPGFKVCAFYKFINLYCYSLAPTSHSSSASSRGGPAAPRGEVPGGHRGEPGREEGRGSRRIA